MQPAATQPRTSGTSDLRVSIVVPVFNSAASLGELHSRIDATLGSTPGVGSWELILVNDGSVDESWATIVRLSREHPEVRGMDLTGNWGQHNALLAGIHSARKEVIVTLDDDLQNPPEEIPHLLGALEGMDLVYGVPGVSSHPVHRRIGTAGMRAVRRAVTRRHDAGLATGFRAFRSKLTEQLPESAGRHVVLRSLLKADADRIGSVAVKHEPRRVGRSNYSLPMLVRRAFTEIATYLRLGRRNGRRGPSYEVRAVTESQAGGDEDC